MPSKPVATKDPRQPRVAISTATSGSDSADPAVEPLLKIALARPRSTRGNQLKATLAKEGCEAASPAPSISRAPTNWNTPRAAPVAAVNNDHQPTAATNATRTPTLSMNQPAGSCMKA